MNLTVPIQRAAPGTGDDEPGKSSKHDYFGNLS
jgi:hypothetical protein